MAAEAIAAPATYKQPSRKGKKAWRKNVDLTEVSNGLDAVRDEIIQGGVFSERPSDELFTTDIAGDAEVAKRFKGKKLLKADEILGKRSAVPGLEGRKRAAQDHEPSGSRKKQKNGTYISHRELQKLRMISGSTEVQDVSASFDPWAVVESKPDPRLNFLEEAKPTREPKSLKEAPNSLATSGKPVPHIRKPEGGKSYNPLVGDWSALLEREGTEAVAAEHTRLLREAADVEAQARAEAEAARVEAAEKDEYATDYDSAWESEWDGIQSGAEDEVHIQKTPRRKTPAERNKIKARKEREAREAWEKKQKVRDDQEKRIKQIAREMSAKDRLKQNAKSLAVRDDSSDSDVGDIAKVELKRRRFGQLPIPEAPLEVVLPEELEDSLRRLKPEGNLLTDRYRNLLINGKIEARKRVWQRKQAKKERTEKWSYKDWKL
nr:uncharacterized protein c22f8.09 [Quercus suber]